FRHQRRHFLEYFTSLLHEQFIRLANTGFISAVQKAEVVADVVGELGFQFNAKNLETLTRMGVFFPLNQNRGAGIPKNEMAVPFAEVKVPGADFGTDNQDRAG